MSESAGFYLMHRGWMDNPVFKREPYTEREAFQSLIESAAWKPMRRRAGGAIVELERGQLIGSVRHLADAWQWSKSRVDRFLERLADESMIGTDASTGTNIISVCNYDKYQVPSEIDGTPSGTAAGQQRDSSGTNKNKGNEVNKGPKGPKLRDDPEFSEWYAAYPRKADPGRAAKAYRAARKIASAADLLAGALRYSAECDGKERQFIKHPTTWLHAGSWQNEPEPLRTVNGHSTNDFGGVPKPPSPSQPPPKLPEGWERNLERA